MIEAYVRTFVQALRRKSKVNFILSLRNGSKLLDVGCGNNSPSICKALRPDIYYVGLDIGDYNQVRCPSGVADEYIIAAPETFIQTIATFEHRFDALISSHNLEHCAMPYSVLIAMLKTLKPGGRIYLAFPCSASISFPSRRGLNFYDDNTHKELLEMILVEETIKTEGFTIDFVTERHRPLLLKLIGLVLEPLSFLSRRVMVGTWELYGFESIIWATKRL